MFTKITYLRDAVSYVEADGKLDIYNVPDYLEEIKDYLKRRYTKELVLEFSKITFVASIGLRAILELHKIMQEKNGILKLKNVTNEVLYSFEITGFDKFLVIENDSKKQNRQHSLSDKDGAKKPANGEQTVISSAYEVVDRIVKIELNSILYGLNMWHDQVAIIMGCAAPDDSIKSKIVETLLMDDKGFNEAIETYEKISKDEYMNKWTNQHISFNKDIKLLFTKLIPKLKEIRTKIMEN